MASKDKAKDITDFITSQKTLTQPLRDRCDADFALWQPTGFKIDVNKGKYRLVTSNRSRVWADKVSGELNSAKLQWGLPLEERAAKSVRERFAQTERTAYGLLAMADKNLRAQIKPSIQGQMSFDVSLRGWVVPRVWLFEEDEKLCVDVAMWDIFSTYWLTDGKGLSRAAFVSFMSPLEASEQYGIDAPPTVNDLVKVIHHWDKEDESIVIDNRVVDSQTNWCKYVPVLILPVGSVPYVQSALSSDTIKHVGESVLAKVRHIAPILSEVLSYYLTATALGTHTPIVTEYDGSDGKGPPEFDPNPYETGANIPLDVARKEKIYPMFQPTTPQQAAALYQMVESEFVRGSAADIFYGQNPASGTTAQGTAMLIHAALASVKDCKKAMEQALSWLANEMIRQYKNGSFEDTEIQGIDGKEKPFSIKVKRDELITDRDFITDLKMQTPTDEWQQAQMLLAYKGQGIISKQTTRDKSGLVPDTDAEQEIIDREQAADIPEVKMFMMLKELLDDKNFVGAKAIWEKIQMSRMQEQRQPGAVPMARPPDGLMPARQMMPTTSDEARLAQMGMMKGR